MAHFGKSNGHHRNGSSSGQGVLSNIALTGVTTGFSIDPVRTHGVVPAFLAPETAEVSFLRQ